MKVKELIKSLRSGVYGRPDSEIVANISTACEAASFVEENGLLPDELLARAQAVGMDYGACMAEIIHQFENKVDTFLDERLNLAVEQFVCHVENLEYDRSKVSHGRAHSHDRAKSTESANA